MKRKNNKGFTLIELLAVIVILGIVMVLTTRGVIALIKKTKTAAFIDEYQIILKGVKTQLFANQAVGATNSLIACNDGDTVSSNWCSNKDDYKELYNANDIALRIDAPTGAATNYTITVTAIGGNYKNIDITNSTVTGSEKSATYKTFATLMDKDSGDLSAPSTSSITKVK